MNVHLSYFNFCWRGKIKLDTLKSDVVTFVIKEEFVPQIGVKILVGFMKYILYIFVYWADYMRIVMTIKQDICKI